MTNDDEEKAQPRTTTVTLGEVIGPIFEKAGSGDKDDPLDPILNDDYDRDRLAEAVSSYAWMVARGYDPEIIWDMLTSQDIDDDTISAAKAVVDRGLHEACRRNGADDPE
jgi:hypothetical protein